MFNVAVLYISNDLVFIAGRFRQAHEYDLLGKKSEGVRPSVVDHHGRSLGGLARVWLRLLLAVLQN